VPAGSWGWFKVPGCWPGTADYMQKDFQTVYAHPSWKNESLRNVSAAWYERTISVPKEWEGRRIALSMDYLNSYAVVFLDGRENRRYEHSYATRRAVRAHAVRIPRRPCAGDDTPSQAASSPDQAAAAGSPPHPAAATTPSHQAAAAQSPDQTAATPPPDQAGGQRPVAPDGAQPRHLRLSRARPRDARA